MTTTIKIRKLLAIQAAACLVCVIAAIAITVTGGSLLIALLAAANAVVTGMGAVSNAKRLLRRGKLHHIVGCSAVAGAGLMLAIEHYSYLLSLFGIS